MTGKSYELPDDITGLGGMVSWADGDGVWHTEVFEFLADARYAFCEHVQAGDTASLARLVRLDRKQALLASAVVMDAAGWACTAQGAYGLARMCFSAALPFIAAWAVGSLWAR